MSQPDAYLINLIKKIDKASTGLDELKPITMPYELWLELRNFLLAKKQASQISTRPYKEISSLELNQMRIEIQEEIEARVTKIETRADKKAKEHASQIARKDKADMEVGKVKACWNSSFRGINCLKSEDRFGFFKGDWDLRPSSCYWINKSKLWKSKGKKFYDKVLWEMAKRMKPRKERYKTGEKALTRQEYDKILLVIEKLEDKVLIKLAVSTGIRREDIVNIKWADVNEKELLITFQERKKRRIWKVYVSREMIQLLKIYQNTIKDRKQKTILPFCGRTAYRRLQELCEKAGINKRPFHALRATCIKFCQAAGWSPEETAKHVGDTIAVINAHYLTPSDAEMREVAMEKMII